MPEVVWHGGGGFKAPDPAAGRGLRGPLRCGIQHRDSAHRRSPVAALLAAPEGLDAPIDSPAGLARFPLNTMCSRKWAIPDSSACFGAASCPHTKKSRQTTGACPWSRSPHAPTRCRLELWGAEDSRAIRLERQVGELCRQNLQALGGSAFCWLKQRSVDQNRSHAGKHPPLVDALADQVRESWSRPAGVSSPADRSRPSEASSAASWRRSCSFRNELKAWPGPAQLFTQQPGLGGRFAILHCVFFPDPRFDSTALFGGRTSSRARPGLPPPSRSFAHRCHPAPAGIVHWLGGVCRPPVQPAAASCRPGARLFPCSCASCGR